MKFRVSISILLFTNICLPVFTDNFFSSYSTHLYTDISPLHRYPTCLENNISILTNQFIYYTDYEDNEEIYSDEEEGNPFLYITFTYLVPVSYFTLSIIFKEIVYAESRQDNPLLYINPVTTSIFSFGLAGLFAGFSLGFIMGENNFFMEPFLFSATLGFLLGITGMIAGGIYAMLNYDTILSNDLFFYGGPVLVFVIPVFDIIRILAEE